MSKHKKSKRKNNNILRQVSQITKKTAQRAVRGLVRDLTALKQRRLSQAGFVLPTVTMVMLVVILLTIAISLRSFDRADQARNVRVNQQLINAATPALDRARAKLYELLQGGDRTSGTPDEDAIYSTLTSAVEVTDDDGNTTTIDKYTFKDETRIKIRFDVDEKNGIDEEGSDDDETTFDDAQEMVKTAWKFRVDTDNDGVDDQETIYGIFFRSPVSETARTPLEARTPPMVFSETTSESSAICNALNSSTGLGGGTGWESRSGSLMKSIFVYIANLPLDNDGNPLGNSGISALEYQQDWTDIPASANAIRYEGDLEIAPGPAFRLNGKIQSLGNMIVSPSGSNDIDFYLVSAPESCYYTEENNEITVGGHLVNGLVGSASDPNTASRIKIHLMDGATNDPRTDVTLEGAESTTADSKEVYYDKAAYETRLKALFKNLSEGTTYPITVQEDIDDGESEENALLTYFSGLVRNVPRADTSTVSCSEGSGNCVEGEQDNLRPNQDEEDALIFPDSISDIPIQYLDATDPEILENNPKKHFQIGDRVLVGNNLPSKWWDEDKEEFVKEEELTDEYWLDENGDPTANLRVRSTQVKSVTSVGATERDGLWERMAVKEVEDVLANEGGLRVITGAGIYSREDSFLPPPSPKQMYGDTGDRFTVVWPDTMPMSPPPGAKTYNNNEDEERWMETDDSDYDPNAKGDLQMRASVVYHYAHDWGKKVEGEDLEPQEPVYCVSSYYDPSTEETAQNKDGLPWNANAAGKSNNGIVYDWPGETAENTYADDLDKQALLVYPNGRFVNELLYKALYDDAEVDKAATERTLAEQAAVDAAVCGLYIWKETPTPVSSPELPHGAIKEIAFLDTRQVKGLDDDDSDTSVDETFTFTSETTLDKSDNDLPLEERQPLEIRATQLDLNLLRNAEITVEVEDFKGPEPEYFLPNTGIVYASRDDALPDLSAVLKTIGDSSFTEINDPYDIDEIKDDPDLVKTSDNDMLLDPTRRPNGIMLINGRKLARNDGNNDGHNDTTPTTLDDISKEKGLVLISNDPVYVYGTFNPHQHEEFNEKLNNTWSNFYSRGDSGLDVNFACRPGDPRLSQCTEGDSWRSVKVIADGITVMSDEWKPGYRNHGDFDLRNNNGDAASRIARLFNGFFANDYAINGLSANWSFPPTGNKTKALEDSHYSGASSTALNSSYFNNFQTPVQRRVDSFPEYLMEMCPKAFVSECTPEDWIVGYDDNANGNYDETFDLDINEDGTKNSDDKEGYIKAYQIAAVPNFKITKLRSGSTRYLGSTESAAMTALQKDYQRYPHRVAFMRNAYGQLVLSDTNLTAIPIGMDTSRKPKDFPYSSSTLSGIMTNNRALWFRTTTNASNPSDTSKISYANNRPLFYLDPSDLSKDSPYSKLADPEIDPDNWLLPDTEFIDLSIPNYPTVEFDLGDANKYAICLGTGGTGPVNFIKQSNAKYQITSTNTDSVDACKNLLYLNGRIAKFRGDLLDKNKFEPDTNDTDTDTNKETTEINAPDHFWDSNGNLYLDAINSTPTKEDDIWDTDTNSDSYFDGVLVYDIPSSKSTIGSSSAVKTITIAGNSDDIFVLRASGAVTFDVGGVRMLLKGGVKPNNIFWVVNGGVTFKDASTTSPKAAHQLTGNFIGSAKLNIGDNTFLLGVRLLGFSGIFKANGTTAIVLWNPKPPDNHLASSTLPRVTAMTSQAQPLLVPVLQIHQPNAEAAANTTAIPTSVALSAAKNTKWMPRAADTTFNLIFSGGDVPSDPENNLTNGGVQNIVRLMENWQVPTQRTTTILGAFMQSGRSKFATAPLQQAEGDTNVDSHLFGYDMRYSIGTGESKHGIFSPPDRQWGYDVGLLSQPMDKVDVLLSESGGDPDEYFREISKDDRWVKGLLCSVEENDDPVVSDLYNSNFCDGYREP